MCQSQEKRKSEKKEAVRRATKQPRGGGESGPRDLEEKIRLFRSSVDSLTRPVDTESVKKPPDEPKKRGHDRAQRADT